MVIFRARPQLCTDNISKTLTYTPNNDHTARRYFHSFGHSRILLSIDWPTKYTKPTAARHPQFPSQKQHNGQYNQHSLCSRNQSTCIAHRVSQHRCSAHLHAYSPYPRVISLRIQISRLSRRSGSCASQHLAPPRCTANSICSSMSPAHERYEHKHGGAEHQEIEGG